MIRNVLTSHQVQDGGSFDIDYQVFAPGERIITEGHKERQGEFVFTANDLGEYRFCFSNEMSTFADKTVDFEIAVRLTMFPNPVLTWNSGRERRASRTPHKARLHAGSDLCPRRVHPQAVHATIHHQPQPKVLPDAGKPKLQHSQEHGASHFQL
jgi:hypothetical protein